MYTLLWEDHLGLAGEVYIFETEDEAYMFAKDRCEDVYEENGHKVDYTLTSLMRKAGWLFFATTEDLFSMRIEKKEFTRI